MGTHPSQTDAGDVRPTSDTRPAAMILAAGRGSRLGPLGVATPKVLLEIAGEPLLARHLRHLESEGFGRVVINAHHLAGRIDRFVGEYRGSLQVKVLVEREPLGTAGGVRNALQYFSSAFVVLYGDVVFDEPLTPLLAAHERSGAEATLAVYEAPSTIGKGVVELDQGGRVRGFAEKQSEGPGLVNAGLYVLEPSFLADVEPGRELDFGHDILPAAVAAGKQVHAYVLGQPVIDIGTPEAFARAQGGLRSRSDTESATPVDNDFYGDVT